MKKYFKLIIAAIIALIFIGTFVFLWQKSQPKEVQYSEFTTGMDSIRKTTIITGKIEPRNEVNIKPQISGIIAELYKEPGQYVNAGDIIAKVKVIPDMAQLSSAESRVRLSNINLKQVETDYSRTKNLHDQKLVSDEDFEKAIYDVNGFLQQFYLDFGNVWDYYVIDSKGFNNRLEQPELTLPFTEDDEWSITGGPHESWTTGSPLGALDFAPRMAEQGCARSDSWITASAPGLVIRTGVGTVVLDLDMDGHEETGWVIYYLHVRTDGKAEPGTRLPLHGRIGHPSCEGGNATGTHLHIARKFNGEWVQAYGPLPFNMSGWIPFGGESYRGGVQRDDDVIYAQTYATSNTLVHY